MLWRTEGLPRAIEDYDRAIKLNPDDAPAYRNRGRACYFLRDYQHALGDYDRAVELDPDSAPTYFYRALASLGLKHIEEAYSDFRHYQKLEPIDINAAWMAEWTHMGWCRPGLDVAEKLEKMAAGDPQPENVYAAYLCRGVASGLRGKLKEGLAELERAIALDPQEWDAYFWAGMLSAYFYKGRYQIAVEALEQALAVGLPPVLLTPLHWLEAERTDFYEQHAKPLLGRYEV